MPENSINDLSSCKTLKDKSLNQSRKRRRQNMGVWRGVSKGVKDGCRTPTLQADHP